MLAPQTQLPPEFDSPWAQQCQVEFFWLLAEMAGSTSILEIGSCYGHSLRLFALAMAGGYVGSIELGTLGPQTGQWSGIDITEKLKAAAQDISDCGFKVDVLFGDSHDPRAIEWARERGPYDFIFIDGDHTCGGVTQDWLNYGPMGRMVAFHDIVNPYAFVSTFWDELKKQDDLIVKEKIASHMGIGLVERKS